MSTTPHTARRSAGGRRRSTVRRRLVAALAAAGLAVSSGAAAAQAPDAGEDQQPFACTAQDHGLELIVDNQDGEGVEVRDPDTDELLGYSRDCDAETRFSYLAMGSDGFLYTIRDHDEAAPGGTLDDLLDAAFPDEVEVAMLDGDDLHDLDVDAPVPYLVRHERGVTNRFISSTSMLVGADEVLHGQPDGDDVDHDLWNDRLLFQFQGGVGIGHSQGEYEGHLDADGDRDDRARAIRGEPDLLSRGYAVIYSTATRTSDHYNLLLSGRTAEMVKDDFVEAHGEPRSTVGSGASGGGIMQYVLNQNHPDILDGAVPQYSYPDMTTQTIHVGDCSLLARWMDLDAPASGDDTWTDWDTRQWLQGMNSQEGVLGSNAEDLAALKAAFGDAIPMEAPTGSSECLEAWLGLAPLAMNPHFGSETNWDLLGDQVDDIERTHWSDVREVYGVDPDTGFARVPWDNVGVQYGLRSVADGRITPDQFLDLNARVGSWKEQEDMVQEGVPFVGSPEDIAADPDAFDPWSRRNMHLSPTPAGEPDPVPAPRRDGDLTAIRNAHEMGLVTSGDPVRQIPTIDVRPYLEHVYDMHNSHQSFAMRQRLLDGQGHHDNQVIWFLDTDENGDTDAELALFLEAYEVLDEWLVAMETAGSDDPGAHRPDGAVDRCVADDGTPIAAGAGVWAGVLDDRPDGDCTAAFELFTTSRIEAGAPINGDVYKCRTMPVGAAIDEGMYGDWTPDDEQVTQLAAIHPDGVCDYDLRGQGDPRGDDIPGRVTAAGGAGQVTVTGVTEGATVFLRSGGDEVTRQTVTSGGEATFDELDAGTYVAVQWVDGQRGLLSDAVTVAPRQSPFPDLPLDNVHIDAILRLVDDGVIDGKTDGRFEPAGSLTRGQLAAMLFRTGGFEAATSPAPFDDVAGSPHADAIAALAEAGVVEGREDGTFQPSTPVRRDQIASMLGRWLGLEESDDDRFSDVTGGPHRGHVNALAEAGIIEGLRGGTEYGPSRETRRDQAASLLVRSLDQRDG